nr:hypothetical protein [uncultured Campylobacter sp.]
MSGIYHLKVVFKFKAHKDGLNLREKGSGRFFVNLAKQPNLDEVKFAQAIIRKFTATVRISGQRKRCQRIKHKITSRKGEFKNPVYTFLTDFA